MDLGSEGLRYTRIVDRDDLSPPKVGRRRWTTGATNPRNVETTSTTRPPRAVVYQSKRVKTELGIAYAHAANATSGTK